jgi:hypothetical protein
MKTYLFCVALIAGATVLTAGETATTSTDGTPKPSASTPQITLAQIPAVVDPLETAPVNAKGAAQEDGNSSAPLPTSRREGSLPAVALESAPPSMAAASAEEPVTKPQTSKLWVGSIFALTGGTTLDGISSWGKKEANPLLASANGTFGMRGALIKSGLAALILTPQLIHKPKTDEDRKVMTTVNLAGGGVYMAVAMHNFRLH